jgi:methylated-DNA-[protein]-cysteine S-methyltransferase
MTMTDMCYYTQMTSPIGDIVIVATQDVLAGCYFVGQRYFPNASNWQQKLDHPILQQTKKQLSAYFSKQHQQFDLPVSPSGTAFQKTVWQALCNVPYGKTASYQDIANAIGKPTATRAVGTAIGKNPISILIPCHRIIGTDRKLHGYAGGLDKKEFLLQLEQGTEVSHP